MRAVIITQDEPFAVPVLLEELLARRADAISCVIIAPPTSQHESFSALVRRWWSAFGPLDFFRYAARFVTARLLGRGPDQVALRHGVDVAHATDINAPDFLEELRELQPDLIISVACPQIFREDLLRLPARGCINVHSGPLPRYRGQLPTFWVLYHGETQTAVTVHYMNRRVDDGPILLQESVDILPHESQASLMRRCKRTGGELLARAIALFEQGDPPTRPNPRDKATFFRFPSPEEAREFRRRGGRWL
ncbi:MAG: formyl transferase [Armatimonadetes bacterium]|nr:formyl transferase [Armatimonadota bacterium]